MMTKQLMRMVAGVALAAGLGCGAGSGSSSDVAAFRSGVPQKEALSINLPGASGIENSDPKGGLETLGETAELYKVTRLTTLAVNGSVAVVVGLLKAISDLPPSSLTSDTAIWGPGNGNGLDPLVYRMVVKKVSDGFTVELQARPKASTNDADFVDIIAGKHDPSNGQNRGSMTIDLDAGNRLAPVDYGSTGQLVVNYTGDSSMRTLTVDFRNFVDRANQAPGAQPVTAMYTYTEQANREGLFKFVAQSNVTGGPALETLTVQSRWKPEGSGRSDVTAASGDIAANIQGTIAECWDTSYKRTYYSDNFGGAPTEGSPAACVYGAP